MCYILCFKVRSSGYTASSAFWPLKCSWKPSTQQCIGTLVAGLDFVKQILGSGTQTFLHLSECFSHFETFNFRVPKLSTNPRLETHFHAKCAITTFPHTLDLVHVGILCPQLSSPVPMVCFFKAHETEKVQESSFSFALWRKHFSKRYH